MYKRDAMRTSAARRIRGLWIGTVTCVIVFLCLGVYWLQLPHPLTPTIPATPLGPVHYHVIDLGIAPLIDVDVNLVPYAALAGINHFGQIAGVTRSQAFLWTPDVPGSTTGALKDFSALFPPGTLRLKAINDYGQIAGTWQSQQAQGVSATDSQAFLWTPTEPNGTVGTILYFPHASHAWGLNTMGQVLLDDMTLWTPVSPHSTRGTLTSLAGLARGPTTFLLNDYGQVAANGLLWTPTAPNGTSGTVTTFYTGDIELTSLNAYGQILFVASIPDSTYLWTPSHSHGEVGSLTHISGLFGDRRLAPEELSQDGTVVGNSFGAGAFFLFGSVEHAVVWQPTAANARSGRLLTLGGVGNDVDSSTTAINAADTVVGMSCTKVHDAISIAFCNTPSHAFIWDEQHGLHNLQPVLAADTPYTLFDVEAIGPGGEIAAMGTGSDQQPHLLLLVPDHSS